MHQCLGCCQSTNSSSKFDIFVLQKLASRTTDYDSRLVDGRYVTSVPIIGINDDDNDIDEGNLRPVHRAPPMSSNGKLLT